MSWKNIELAKVCEVFADGDWIESKDQSDIGIRLIQTGNVGFGRFKARDSKARYINEETFKRLRCTEIKEGDLLVSRLPDPVGRACIIPQLVDKSITAVDCTIIRTKQEILCSNYLNYYCQSPQYFEQVKKNITGATRQRISRSLLGKTLIPLAPLQTQQKIVAKLDAIFTEIDTATASAEANANNAEALFQSYLNEVFASKENLTKLKNCTQIKPPKSEIKNLKGNTSVSFMPMESLGINDKFTISKQSKDLVSVSGSYTYFTEGDVLLAKITPCFENGKLGIASNLVNGIGFGSSEYIVFRPNKNIDKEWLYYFLNRESFRILGSQHMSGSVGHKRVTKEFIEDTLIPLVPISKQIELVSKIDNIFLQTQTLKKVSQSKIRELFYFKQSILQKAFSGELVKD